MSEEKKFQDNEPVLIYQNGWYYIAKKIENESNQNVYEIDFEMKNNGFPEAIDAVMYYKYSTENQSQS